MERVLDTGPSTDLLTEQVLWAESLLDVNNSVHSSATFNLFKEITLCMSLNNELLIRFHSDVNTSNLLFYYLPWRCQFKYKEIQTLC